MDVARWPLESECDFRQRIGRLLAGDDHWWKVRPLVPTWGVKREVLSALDVG